MFWLEIYKFLGNCFSYLFKGYFNIRGGPDYFDSLRLGSIEDIPKSRMWVHAVSVGELKAVEPFIEELKKRKYRVLLTTGTRSGFDLGKVIYKDDSDVFVTVMPFDFSKNVKSFFSKAKPQAVFFVETELWPVCISECKKRKLPLFWLNGRISDRAFKAKGLYYKALSWMIGQFDLCFMKSLEDLRKASTISKSSVYKKIKGVCLGDLKYDKIPKIKRLKRSVLKIKNEKIIVLGSSHYGEEDLVCDAYRVLKNKFKNLKLVIAPRKIERKEYLRNLFSDFKTVSWSEGQDFNWEKIDILLIDEIGLLSNLYSIGDVALVGGSWVKRGGHNPIEPSFFGVPTIFGPSMDNFREVAQYLVNSGGAMSASSNELVDVIENLLKDKSKRKEVGLFASEAVKSRKGVSKRLFNEIEKLIQQGPKV